MRVVFVFMKIVFYLLLISPVMAAIWYLKSFCAIARCRLYLVKLAI